MEIDPTLVTIFDINSHILSQIAELNGQTDDILRALRQGPLHSTLELRSLLLNQIANNARQQAAWAEVSALFAELPLRSEPEAEPEEA